MISFHFKLMKDYNEWHGDKSFSYLEYEGEIKIIIGSSVFYQDSNFLILEFLRDALAWIEENSKKDMVYNSIETEENPLISFQSYGDLWGIYSPWQKYSSKDRFYRRELVHAISQLKEDVEKQIKLYQEQKQG